MEFFDKHHLGIERDTFNSIEKKEKPKISIDFFFSAHGTREDYERLKELINNADIIIPEQFGNTEKSENDFNLVSEGKINPDSFPESLRNSAQGFLLELIYKTKKPIFLVDIPKESVSMIEEREEKISQLLNDSHKFFQSGEFDKALRFLRLYIELKDKIDKIRDDYIANNILKISKNVEEDIEFKGKDVKILVCLGAMHTDVLYEVSKKNDTLSTKMHTGKESGIVFSYLGEMYRRERNNKEIDDLIVARALIEEYVQRWISSFNFKIRDGLKKTEFIRKISSLFSLDEIKQFGRNLSDISEGISGESSSYLSLPLVRIIKFVEILKSKGVDIKKEEEIDVFLKKRK